MKLFDALLACTDVTINGIVTQEVWACNLAIVEWGLCWRVPTSKQFEIACLVMLKGNMMLGHSCVIAIDEEIDNPNKVDILISLTPNGNPNGEPKYVAVSLSWSKCT